MSSGRFEGFYSNASKKSKDHISRLNFDISKAVIPFSRIFKEMSKEDIYSGNERIPFRERHPIFRSLLRVEFEDAMKEYFESLK